MARTTVELVYVEGCPNVAAARENLRRALRAAARPAIWSEWEQNDPAAPARVRAHPSPTVLVDGRDVSGEAPGPSAQACRAGGAPSVDRIRKALLG
jgi:hypothetical protein